MDTAIKVLNYVADYINSVPASSWYALGTLLGGSAIVTGIVAWINRHRLKNDLEKLGRAMVTWVVVFLSAVITVLDFVLNNGTTFGHFLPYFGTHMPQIIGISTIIYNVSKPTLEWFKARKDGVPITNPTYTPPVLPNSFGNAANGRPAPSENLLQL
jgi:hypothetical protein